MFMWIFVAFIDAEDTKNQDSKFTGAFDVTGEFSQRLL